MAHRPRALPGPLAQRLGAVVTVASALVALASAVGMRDRVRLVDVLMLFVGGVGTGAGVAELVARRRLAARDGRRGAPDARPSAAWPLPPSVPAPHAPPADRHRPPA